MMTVALLVLFGMGMAAFVAGMIQGHEDGWWRRTSDRPCCLSAHVCEECGRRAEDCYTSACRKCMAEIVAWATSPKNAEVAEYQAWLRGLPPC